MKFVVSSNALLKQLTAINGVITTNPVVPILENFLFEIGENLAIFEKFLCELRIFMPVVLW